MSHPSSVPSVLVGTHLRRENLDRRVLPFALQIVQVALQVLKDLLADLDTEVNELRSVLAAQGGAEGFLDPLDTAYAPGEFADHLIDCQLPVARHEPDRMGEVIRPPAKLVGVIEGVHHE